MYRYPYSPTFMFVDVKIHKSTYLELFASTIANAYGLACFRLVSFSTAMEACSLSFQMIEMINWANLTVLQGFTILNGIEGTDWTEGWYWWVHWAIISCNKVKGERLNECLDNGIESTDWTEGIYGRVHWAIVSCNKVKGGRLDNWAHLTVLYCFTVPKSSKATNESEGRRVNGIESTDWTEGRQWRGHMPMVFYNKVTS